MSAPDGERRLLLLLFSDLVGSTQLSQMIDPEDYADLLLEYQKVSRRIVLTNGGGIANYPGDGIRPSSVTRLPTKTMPTGPCRRDSTSAGQWI